MVRRTVSKEQSAPPRGTTARRTAGLVGVLAAIAAFAALFAFAGAFPVAADEPHWSITTRIIEFARDRAIEQRSSSVALPPLADERLAMRGAAEYAEMCVACHGAPGSTKNELSSGLYPRPPDLGQHRMDPRRTFWVIKHGLKMTGMPAWGASHDDESIWSMVAFIDRLPGMSPETYRQWSAAPATGRQPPAVPATAHGGSSDPPAAGGHAGMGASR